MSLLDLNEAETQKYLAERSQEKFAEMMGVHLLQAGKLSQLEALYRLVYSGEDLDALKDAAAQCARLVHDTNIRMAAYREGRTAACQGPALP